MEDNAVKSNNPESVIFDADREHYSECRNRGQATPQFIRDTRGWILFGPQDVRSSARSFTFCLQKLPGQKLPRVRAGCRYYTLPKAWHHWSRKIRTGYTIDKNEGRQALALLLLQAQAYGLISIYASPIKFDSTILKPKRK
jgi:hypothetical protein